MGGQKHQKGPRGSCSLQGSSEPWAGDANTPWEDKLLLPRNRQIRLVSLEFSDIFQMRQRGEKNISHCQNKCVTLTASILSHPLTFCPLLLQQLEVVLFLMGQRSPTFEKVPCHQLHVKMHFTYLKEGQLHRKWGDGVEWVCKKMNTKRTKDYSASNTSSTVRAYHVACIQPV